MPIVGKIYRIEFPDGYFYIGRTIWSLAARLKAHEKSWMNAVRHNQQTGRRPIGRFEIYLGHYGWINPTISLVSEHVVEAMTDLHAIETSEIKKVFYDDKNLNERCKGAKRAMFLPENLPENLW